MLKPKNNTNAYWVFYSLPSLVAKQTYNLVKYEKIVNSFLFYYVLQGHNFFLPSKSGSEQNTQFTLVSLFKKAL